MLNYMYIKEQRETLFISLDGRQVIRQWWWGGEREVSFFILSGFRFSASPFTEFAFSASFRAETFRIGISYSGIVTLLYYCTTVWPNTPHLMNLPKLSVKPQVNLLCVISLKYEYKTHKKKIKVQNCFPNKRKLIWPLVFEWF